MDFTKYKQGLKRLARAIDKISDYYHCSKFRIYLDALFCHIIYGVTPNEYLGWCFYAKSTLERKSYYTARRFKQYEPKLNDKEGYYTFWNKKLFNDAFSEFIGRDWLYVPDASDDEVQAFIERHNIIIVKPTSMSSGKGIHLLGKESVDNLRKGKYILEECIQQHHTMNSLNPSSVNSIRMYTILSKLGHPHVLSACLRVGGTGSVTDNFHSGGVAYPIDINTGVIIAAGASMSGDRFYFHPGSEIQMIGFAIPRWSELIEFVVSAATKYPKSRMIAWDVAIMEDGFALIEGNYNGGPTLLQLQKGQLHEIRKYL